jgi:hypothetical protein
MRPFRAPVAIFSDRGCPRGTFVNTKPQKRKLSPGTVLSALRFFLQQDAQEGLGHRAGPSGQACS